MTHEEIYQAFIGQRCERCSHVFTEGETIYDIPNNPGKILCGTCYEAIQERLRREGYL